MLNFKNRNLLSESELENISGGSIKAKSVKGLFAVLGVVTFGKIGEETGKYWVPELYKHFPGVKFVKQEDGTTRLADESTEKNTTMTGRILGICSGVTYGLASGWQLGEWLCEKWGIKD